MTLKNANQLKVKITSPLKHFNSSNPDASPIVSKVFSKRLYSQSNDAMIFGEAAKDSFKN
jgi:hypothetical protein